MSITVVTFYTNDFYEEQAKNLGISCRKYDVPIMISKSEDRGSWVKNCAFKSYFIYDKLMSLNTDVLWLDADCYLMKHPLLFNTITEDFAVRAEAGGRTKKPAGREIISLPDNWPNDVPPCWFNSGTIFFKNNDKSKELCRRWLKLCTKNETDWDQWTLQQAWCDIQPSTYWLPREYCQIRKLHGENGAVILHELGSVIQKVDRK